jgi:hypothetical protein
VKQCLKKLVFISLTSIKQMLYGVFENLCFLYPKSTLCNIVSPVIPQRTTLKSAKLYDDKTYTWSPRMRYISNNIVGEFVGSISRWNFIGLKTQYTTVNYNQ